MVQYMGFGMGQTWIQILALLLSHSNMRGDKIYLTYYTE